MDSPTLYLIDGSAYIYRAYHAIRGLTNSHGVPTNAVLGFTKMLIKLVADRSPEYIGMCFDSRGPTFRHKLYEQYKANRPPMPEDLVDQLPIIKQVTAAFNIPVIEKPGYEADDLIGTLCRQATESGFAVVMVTGDKDFIQLVSDAATIWDPMKDKVTDLAAVRETFSLEPSQIIDVMGLSGDSADNVPGVPGIGPKTGQTLIREFDSMDRLYRHLDSITRKKQREKLVAYRDQAFLSRTLVTIDTSAPVTLEVDALRYAEPDSKALADLFQELEFRQLHQQFATSENRVEKRYHAVTDAGALAELVARIASADLLAVDTETTSKNPMLARLVGVSVAIQPDEAYYIPCGHRYIGAPEQLSLSAVIDALKPVLENPDLAKVGQNIKYDWMVFRRHGCDLQGVVFDTMVASYLLNPSKRAHGLDQIALDFLGHKTTTYKEVVGTGKGALDSFARVPLEAATPYACEDADITLTAYRCLQPMLEERGLLMLMDTVEMPLVRVLLEMEMQGIAVDRDHLAALSLDFEGQLVALEKEIHQLAGEVFNIRSSQQLGTILFEKLKLPVVKKTKKKTGYSTDVDVLTNLAEKHELPAYILRHRTLSKLKSTYADALLELVHPETGRIHTSFNQTITATGRLSSSDPNLQNIPVRTPEGRSIRRAFIPQPGWVLVAADYSQIELRILAHCSKDAILIEAFRNGEDIHNRTAAEVFQVFPSFIDDDMRRQAKVINFGIIYGMSPFGLSKALGISRKMATAYIDNYFKRYRGVKTFIDDTIEATREKKMVSTLLDRIRLLPEIDSSNRNVRMFAERTAVNTRIQGSSADLIKVAMIQVHDAFRKEGLRAAMLLSVHDEIVFECPPQELAQARQLVTARMEGVWQLRVPLCINIKEGTTWDFKGV